MPRSLQEIIDHADELADRFEFSGDPGSPVEGEPLRRLAVLVEQRGENEAAIRDAVVHARDACVPWVGIGAMLGTSGEAARQRYGTSRRTAGA